MSTTHLITYIQCQYWWQWGEFNVLFVGIVIGYVCNVSDWKQLFINTRGCSGLGMLWDIKYPMKYDPVWVTDPQIVGLIRCQRTTVQNSRNIAFTFESNLPGISTCTSALLDDVARFVPKSTDLFLCRGVFSRVDCCWCCHCNKTYILFFFCLGVLFVLRWP